jgi:hypothetical protein
MNESELLTQTYTLLDQSGEPIRVIADGAGVNYHWLGKFKQRRFENPGVITVERLHRFLSERAPSDTAAA